jgi:putative hydrolase of the HAD superfamily
MAKRRTIQAVVFDLDDTLFLERHYVRSGYKAVADHLRNQLGRADRFEAWLWGQFLSGRRERLFDLLCERFELSLDCWGIGEMVEIYRCHRPVLVPCRGMAALLERLRRRGKKLALLSDGFLPAQRLKLEALGLERFFEAVLFTEELGRLAWKPSTVAFERLSKQLQVPHEACAYVADNPAKDFLPGNKLGWLTIQWRRRGQVHADQKWPFGGKPRRVVRNAQELVRLLG